MSKKVTHEEFIEKVKNNFKEIPYNILSKYTKAQEYILVSNNYGNCYIKANHMINGHIPTIKSAIDKNKYFSNQAIEVHGDFYDYSLVTYSGSLTKVKIICKYHGVFEQSPSGHLVGKGCSKCGKIKELKSRTKSTKDFIKSSKILHNNFYSYLRTNYKSAKEKVIITCPTHGEFEQTPDNHLQRKGCTKCAKLASGWEYSKWQKAGERSKQFDSFKVYIIKCSNEKEEFYKIGKTFRKITQRFQGKKKENSMPYNYEIIKVFKGEAREISELEHKLQKENKEFKYLPKIEFGGRYECFSFVKNC